MSRPGQPSSTTPASTAPTSTAPSARTLTAALAAVVVLCLAVLTYLFVTDTDGDEGVGTRVASLVTGEGRDAGDDAVVTSRERDAVARQATQFVLRSNTYGPSDLDEQNKLPEYADRVRAVITAKQRADFDKNLTLAEQTVSQAGYGRACQVAATGVVSMSSDEAVALVAGEIIGSYPDPQDPKKRIEDVARQFRIKVDLRKVDGTWLVDTFEPVTGDTEQPTDGTAPAPTAPAEPTEPASSTPAGGGS